MQPPQLPPMLRALRHRNYRLFFFGQMASLIGTWMQFTAQGWLVLHLTDSPALLGVVALSSALPILLFSLPAGVLADRFSHHRLLFTSNLAALLLALALALLTLSGLVRFWHMLLLAFAYGITRAFEAPARQAFTIELVGRADLLNAIALNSTMFNTARTLGPALACFVIAALGEGTAFLINSISFLAVLIGLLLMRLPPFVPPPRTRRREQYAAVMKYLLNEPVVRTLLLLAGSLCLLGYVYVPLLPVFARDVLHTDAQGLGFMGAANGAGALIAALLLARFSQQMRQGMWLVRAVLLLAPLLAAFALVPVFGVALVLLMSMGAAGVTTLALANTLIQITVPDDLRARVMSIFVMLPLGMTALGGMLAGTLVEWSGSVALVVLGCALLHLMLVSLLLWRIPRLWQL